MLRRFDPLSHRRTYVRAGKVLKKWLETYRTKIALKAVAYVLSLSCWARGVPIYFLFAAGQGTCDYQRVPRANLFNPPDRFPQTCLLLPPRPIPSFHIQSALSVQNAQQGHRPGHHQAISHSLHRTVLSPTYWDRKLDPSARLEQHLAPSSRAVHQLGRPAQPVRCPRGAEGPEAPREPQIQHQLRAKVAGVDCGTS